MTPTLEQKKNRLAMIKIDRKFLVDLIGLPHETMIQNAFMDMATMEVYFIVESPDLPEIPEGMRPPVANPSVTTIFDWGLEKKHDTRS